MNEDDLPWVDTPFDTPPEIAARIKQEVEDSLNGNSPLKPKPPRQFNDDEVVIGNHYFGFTKEDLDKLFVLSPDGSSIINLRARGKERKGEEVKTSLSNMGYRTLTLKKKKLQLQKVVYLMIHGQVSRYMNPIDGRRTNCLASNWMPVSLNQSIDREVYLKMRAKQFQSK